MTLLVAVPTIAFIVWKLRMELNTRFGSVKAWLCPSLWRDGPLSDVNGAGLAPQGTEALLPASGSAVVGEGETGGSVPPRPVSASEDTASALYMSSPVPASPNDAVRIALPTTSRADAFVLSQPVAVDQGGATPAPTSNSQPIPSVTEQTPLL